MIIKNNEIVPADILLLSIEKGQNECFVDKSKVLGWTNVILKNPIRDTQSLLGSRSIDELIHNMHKLSAKIKIPESAKLRTGGSIKLSVSPNLTEVKQENFIYKFSRIYETE